MKMLDNIHDILDMRYADFGAERTLEDLVKEILFEALKVVLVAERKMPELSAGEEDKLDEAKLLIEKDCPRYRGNEKLKKAVGLNEFLFYTGFKQKFKLTPHDHHLEVKMMIAKQLLREGLLVNDVAHLLEYGSLSPLIERFRKMYGCTPKEFQMGRYRRNFSRWV